jgi:hypothetical protein
VLKNIKVEEASVPKWKWGKGKDQGKCSLKTDLQMKGRLSISVLIYINPSLQEGVWFVHRPQGWWNEKQSSSLPALLGMAFCLFIFLSLPQWKICWGRRLWCVDKSCKFLGSFMRATGVDINNFTTGNFRNTNKKYANSQNFTVNKVFSKFLISLDSHNSQPWNITLQMRIFVNPHLLLRSM